MSPHSHGTEEMLLSSGLPFCRGDTITFRLPYARLRLTPSVCWRPGVLDEVDALLFFGMMVLEAFLRFPGANLEEPLGNCWFEDVAGLDVDDEEGKDTWFEGPNGGKFVFEELDRTVVVAASSVFTLLEDPATLEDGADAVDVNWDSLGSGSVFFGSWSFCLFGASTTPLPAAVFIDWIDWRIEFVRSLFKSLLLLSLLLPCSDMVVIFYV